MIGKRIKELRKKAKQSQQDLADALGASQRTISHWETGRTTPDPHVLANIADQYNTTVDYIIGRTNNPSPPVRIYTTDSMDSLASHQSSNKEAPITESRLNEILKIAFENYEKRNKF